MPPANPRAFRKAVDAGSVAPVHLLYGDDEFLKDAAVRHAIETLVDPATRDFNLEVRRGADLDAETVHSLLNTPPMMADRRVVVVRDVGALKKDARRALDRYLERPAPDVVLLLTLVAGAKMDEALAANTSLVDCKPLTGDTILRWIEHQAAALGGSIDAAAVELLLGAVGPDLAQLDSELDKLVSYAPGGMITAEAVSAIVGVRPGETVGDFLDAVLERNARRALHLLPLVLAQPKTSGVTLVMALSTQTMALAWARAARDEGLSASQLEREFFGLLKEGGAYPGRSWGEATKAWARALPRWSAPVLDQALDALLAADMALKDTTVSSEEQILASAVLRLCAADAAARPARSAA